MDKGKVKEWASSMRDSEEALVEEVTKMMGQLVEDLMPRARAKAVEENYHTEIVVKIRMDMSKKRPDVDVSGFVPPTILSCREY